MALFEVQSGPRSPKISLWRMLFRKDNPKSNAERVKVQLQAQKKTYRSPSRGTLAKSHSLSSSKDVIFEPGPHRLDIRRRHPRLTPTSPVSGLGSTLIHAVLGSMSQQKLPDRGERTGGHGYQQAMDCLPGTLQPPAECAASFRWNPAQKWLGNKPLDYY